MKYKETNFWNVHSSKLKIGAHKSGGYGDIADYVVLLNSIKEKYPNSFLIAYVGYFEDEGGPDTYKLLNYFDFIDKVEIIKFKNFEESFFSEPYVTQFSKNFNYFYDFRSYVGKVYDGSESAITLDIPFKLPKEWEYDMQWVDFYQNPLSQYQNVLLDHFPDLSHLEITCQSCGLPEPNWDGLQIKLPEDKLKLNMLNDRWITVSPSTAGSNTGISQTKAWDFDKWNSLCDSFKSDGISVIQVGRSGERTLNSVDYFWDETTTNLLQLLRLSPIHISAENGTARMRALVTDKPMVTLFGPTDPTFFGLPNQKRIFTNKCRPCFWMKPNWFTHCHRGDNTSEHDGIWGINEDFKRVCMRSIEPQMVYDSATEIMDELGWKNNGQVVSGFTFSTNRYYSGFSKNTVKKINSSVVDQTKYETGIFDFPYGHTRFFFNPALSKTEDETILWVRRLDVLPRSVKHRDSALFTNSVWPYKLDENMQPKELGWRLMGQYPGEQMEDPRVLIDGDNYLVTCAAYVPETFPFDGKTHQKTYIIGKNGEYIDFRSINYAGNGDNIMDNTRSEKNWTWFVSGGEKYFIYEMNPHHVVQVDPEAKGAEKRYMGSRARWKYGPCRGGSNPVLHDGQFWSFFHSSVDVSPGKRVYFMGWYSFEPEPPFKITGISREPILTGNCVDSGNPYIRSLVIFPGGAYVEDDTWTVVYGINDFSCGWIKIPHGDLR